MRWLVVVFDQEAGAVPECGCRPDDKRIHVTDLPTIATHLPSHFRTGPALLYTQPLSQTTEHYLREDEQPQLEVKLHVRTAKGYVA